MAYIEPGTYIQEIPVPKTAIGAALGFNVCIVGEGIKNKTIYDEVVIRGKIYGEELTVSAVSPHTADLANTSDMKKDNTTLYKDGAILGPDAYDFEDEDTIVILDAYYSSDSIYKIDYVAVDSFTDALDYTPLSIVKIGRYIGSGNYRENTDFKLNTGVIDWSIISGATFTGLHSAPFDLSTNDTIKISLDGKSAIEITITGTNQAEVTASEVAEDINAALASSSVYGEAYSNVASAVSNKVKLTCPNLDPYAGVNSYIRLYKASTNDALEIIFGLDADDAPYEYRGVGKRPLPGQTYYVSYTITRPSDEYNVVKQFISDTDFYRDIGYPASDNKLAIAGSIAWSRGINKLFVVQVKDNDNDGYYSDEDYQLALEAIVDQREITEIVCLRSSSLVRAKIFDLLQQECSLLKSNPKRYWCGVPRGTVIGDLDTGDSLIYIARREFRVNPDSVARGRIILVAPPDCSTSIIQSDGSMVEVSLDSNYCAVLLASEVCVFERASETLFGRKFSGISLDFEYTHSEKKYLAENGVLVLQSDGSLVSVYDSLTTDASGDERYEEVSSSVQKDSVLFKVIYVIDTQLKGIVPDSIIDFIGLLKTTVGGVLLAEIEDGNIGYYTNDDGSVRDIDYSKDILVFSQYGGDKRNYKFKYWFNLKYPAKRFFGEYQVDIPLGAK